MDFNDLALPLLLTFLAGISTGIGSLISLFIRDFKKEHLSLFLGFSAGVILYISFVDLLPTAIKGSSFLSANLALFTGMFIAMLIDRSIPHNYIAEKKNIDIKHRQIFTTSLMTLLGIAIHNFPEGIAVFMSSLNNIKTAIPLAVAIAIHNIPEGISVAMPIYFLTKSRKTSFKYSLLSGLTEPIGAITAWLFLSPFLNESLLSLVLSAVAGMMIFISF